MIDEIIAEEKRILTSRIQKKQELTQSKEQLEAQLNMLEERKSELSMQIIQYPACFFKRSFNFFEKLFSRKKYKKYLADVKKHDEECKAVEKKERARKEQLSSTSVEIESTRSKLLSINTQISDYERFDDESKLERLEKKDQAVAVIMEKHPELSNDLDFMLEIVSRDSNNLQYDRTDNPELYLMAIESLIDKYKTKELNDEVHGNDYIIKTLESYSEILRQKEEDEDAYRIPLKYLHESIRNNIAGLPEEKKKYFVYNFVNPIQSYIYLNDKLPREYGEKMQELWDDKSFRLGAHGLKNHRGDIEYSRTVMKGIFTKGLMTSQHQIGQTDLKFTVKVQGYNPEFSFLNILDYSYERWWIYFDGYSRRMLRQSS